MAGLRKNSDTGMIFGVCAGISEWLCKNGLPIHVAFVRIIFVIGLLSSMGLVGAIYLFLAAVLSDEAK